MKYLILIYSNPASREIWEGFSDEQRAEGFRYYGAITEELAASGELIVTEALADPSLTRRVTVRDGQTLTSDGPFAEAKELLAGFYLLTDPRVVSPSPASAPGPPRSSGSCSWR